MGSPIQIVVPYWEMRPAAMERKLDRLVNAGVESVATFVPWLHFEKDIAHTLRHFLMAAAERQLPVTLFVVPEAGLPTDHGSIPRDLQEKIQPLRDWTHIDVPGIPDPFSGEVVKRILAHVRRVHGVLSDVAREYPRLGRALRVVVSGGYWSTMQPDRARTGLMLLQAEQRFRDKVREIFAQPLTGLRDPLDQISAELWIPELDADYARAAMMSRLVGGRADFSKLVRSLARASFRAHSCGKSRGLWIYFSRAGSFRTLSDAEKQSLILNSATAAGASGGAVMVDEQDWLQLSSAFRSKAEWMARVGVQPAHRVGWLVSHRSLAASEMSHAIRRKFEQDAALLVDDREFVQSFSSRLLMVDASAQVTAEQVQRWSLWVQSGRMLVLSSGALMDPDARAWVEQCFSKAPKRMDLTQGGHFRVAHLGEGKWVYVEGTLNPAVLDVMLPALGEMAQVQPQVVCEGEGIRWAMFRVGQEAGHALLVSNTQRKPVKTQIRFAREVEVTDLMTRDAAKLTQTLELDVPPFGMLPLWVSGLDHVDIERWVAAQESSQLRVSVDAMAGITLEGFDAMAGLGASPWDADPWETVGAEGELRRAHGQL